MVNKNKQCYVCGRQTALQRHHMIHGTANRKKAEQYDLTCYLCVECHRAVHDYNTDLDRRLMKDAQAFFEKRIGTREDFRREFGKSFL